MSSILKLLMVAVIGFAAYQHFSEKNVLIGKWQSNKEASIQQLEDAGIKGIQKVKTSNMLGKMVWEIQEDTFIASIGGETFKSPYSILSEENDCYTISVNEETKVFCVINDLLYAPTPIQGVREVFSRI